MYVLFEVVDENEVHLSVLPFNDGTLGFTYNKVSDRAEITATETLDEDPNAAVQISDIQNDILNSVPEGNIRDAEIVDVWATTTEYIEPSFIVEI